ncbi:MAG: SUMF1/EgtB/PvdO family nonheme iron enzyme [Anaerolineales bacterium]|nr:SUMF1/EgtB/PvdO family nonheme iron enzyme [Anaerolineales bacterium]
MTNAQYQAFIDDGGYTEQWRRCWTAAGWTWKGDRRGPKRYGGVFDLPNHPVVGVTWYEAVAFCKWLSVKSGRQVSLPIEAQWEKAARGTDGRRYPWGQEITPNHANYWDTGIHATSAVGVFPKGESPLWLADAAGNVWELTATKKLSDYQKYAPDDLLEGDARYTLRGGSWNLNDSYVRCARRVILDPFSRLNFVGFRLVCHKMV